MPLPKDFLDSIAGLKGFDKEAFEKVHDTGEQVTSIRLNPLKSEWVNGQLSISIHHSPFTLHNSVPWCRYGFYLSNRPSFTFDPFFHAGCYYVQEASSMFLEQALAQTVNLSASLKVLDVSAAPGGKSTHILSLLSKDSVLVSNEVIKSRAYVLRDNLVKWGYPNFIVTNNDPQNFQRLENYFDVIVIDAPCSGSGLFRRDPEAIEHWSRGNVQLCCQRQKRILADIMPALKIGGVLIYSTCSYSTEENEEIGKWLIEDWKMENLKLRTVSDWAIVEAGPGYRFYPDKLKGEGFFLACFRKLNGGITPSLNAKNKIQKISAAEKALIANWVKTGDHEYILREQVVHAVPASIVQDMKFILKQLHVINFGTTVGEIMRDKLIPHHALAMSSVVSGDIPRMELDYDKAILYLKKKEINVKIEKIGWQLVEFEGHALGWMNILPGRMNNNYPKELRILKD